MSKTRLKIGDFAKFMQVSIKTLRYYEMLGILVPAETDEQNGYRYYHLEQMQRLRAIQDLKALGFGLEDIAELCEQGMRNPDREQLRTKLQECELQLDALNRRKALLELTIHERDALEGMEQFEVQRLPAITVASYLHIRNYDMLGDVCVNVIGPEMQRLGCQCPKPGYCFTTEHCPDDASDDRDIEYCEQVVEAKTDSPLLRFRQLDAVPAALCYKHHGPYSRFYASFVKVFAHIDAAGYRICGDPRISYVDGIWNQPDPEQWLSIIQVPVEME